MRGGGGVLGGRRRGEGRRSRRRGRQARSEQRNAGRARAQVTCQFGLIVDRVLVEHKSMECQTRIAVFWYEKDGYSAVISIRSIWEEHLMSPSSLPEVQEHSSGTVMSPASSTSEVPKASRRTQVDAKKIRLPDMPFGDTNVHIKKMTSLK
ncbi:hypothetical protein ACQJBY_022380 [Aegilops geniculata]